MLKAEQERQELERVADLYSQRYGEDQMIYVILDKKGGVRWYNGALKNLYDADEDCGAELETELRSAKALSRRDMERLHQGLIAPVTLPDEELAGSLRLLMTEKGCCGAVLMIENLNLRDQQLKAKAERYSHGEGAAAYIRTLTFEQRRIIQELRKETAGGPELEKGFSDIELISLHIERTAMDIGRETQAAQGVRSAQAVMGNASEELEELCRKLEKEIARTDAEGVHTEFSYKLPAGRTVVYCMLLLNSAVAELMDNALKNTRGGKIRLTAEFVEGYIKVTVADSGPGISLERQGVIFTASYSYAAPLAFMSRDRTNPTEKGDFLAGGLGLSSLRRQVELAGGELQVTSDGVSGTTAWVKLPCRSLLVEDEELMDCSPLFSNEMGGAALRPDPEWKNYEFMLRMLPSCGMPQSTGK